MTTLLPDPLTRRAFLGGMLSATAGVAFAGQARTWTAAVIGHTGAGNYGHGLDTVFADLPGVRVVAVADADAPGREKARQRIGAAKAYADYREMLAAEKPNLVSVAPRWTEEHFAMVEAALDSGAHVFCEKPFTTTLEEADKLLAKANAKSLRIAVAHQMRMAPNIVKLRAEMANGLLGDLVQMRAFGKQDARAGGEDMMVLGTHQFDLMRLFAGDARRCSATIWTQGRLANSEDRRPATEKIGPILGDEIEAQFEFDRGVIGVFTSRGRLREAIGRWRVELIGTKSSAIILMDIDPEIYLVKTNTAGAEWKPFAPVPPPEKGGVAANRRLALDWLAAIDEKRDPFCSGQNAAKAVEMVMAVYAAHLSARRVAIPLTKRGPWPQPSHE